MMNRQTARFCIGTACLVAFGFTFRSAAHAGTSVSDWRAGVATAVITPEQPMWMAGYAARTKPSEGKIHDLHAKALALEGKDGSQLLIITLDLVSVPRTLRDVVTEGIERRCGVAPKSVLIGASHTHCGPELRMTKAALYGLDPQRVEQARAYTDKLRQTLVNLAYQAIQAKKPAVLSYTHARAGFAMNRRLPTERGFLNRPNPDGPVDHDVPVLRVDSPDGKLIAVLFGYACHATTLSFYQFCGDYPGFAQEDIEQAHPGATAMFLAGCGGDQNPQPRRTLDLARQHGRALANGVEAALTAQARPVRPPLRMALAEVKLQFAPAPSRAELMQQVKSKDKYERRHAASLLSELDEKGAIRTDYPYLVQVVRFGDDLTLIALAGEVVVDYSIRLKSHQGEAPIWVAAYTNDVFGYVPSARVLHEGGYEGGDAMRYTTLPGPFLPSVEDSIINAVQRLLRETAGSQ